MFNGIIFNIGKIKSIKKSKKSIHVGISTTLKFKTKDLGESVCCNGVCLTLVKKNNNIIYFYISNETLKRSNLKLLKINQTINLEKSLSYGKKISGHFIQGHVDTTAIVKKIFFLDKTWLVRFKILDKIQNQIVQSKMTIYITTVFFVLI